MDKINTHEKLGHNPASVNLSGNSCGKTSKYVGRLLLNLFPNINRRVCKSDSNQLKVTLQNIAIKMQILNASIMWANK